MTEREWELERAKLFAEIQHINALAEKTRQEARFYPWIIGFSAIAALGTVTTIAAKIL